MNPIMKSRWKYAIAGAIIMLVIGFIYGWSVMSTPLVKEFGWASSQVSFIFTVLMWAFCAGMIVGSSILKRTTPRITVIISAVFMIAAFALTVLLTTADNPGILIGTYGVLGGLGVGIAYTAAMSVSISWFPDKLGMMSGICLMCYCLSTMLFSTIAYALFEAMGWRTTYIVFAVAIGALLIVLSIWMKNPSADQLDEIIDAAGISKKNENADVSVGLIVDYTTNEMLHTKVFWLYAVWMIMACCICLGTTSFVNQYALAANMDAALAVFSVGLFSIISGLGRLLYGVIIDKKGVRISIASISICLVIGIILMGFCMLNGWSYFMLFALVVLGIGVGAVSVMGSSFTAKTFGTKHYARNLSVINLMIIPAALIGPNTVGLLVGAGYSYAIGAFAICGYGVLACLIMIAFVAAYKTFESKWSSKKPWLQTDQSETEPTE